VDDLNSITWKENGPFELSPERGRFALTYSLVEERSLNFSTALARFVTPDLGYWDGKYVSLFAPAVSFLVIPGYLLGKFIGISQVGSFFIISLFAIANFILIVKISETLGANNRASVLAGLIFLFATPSFAYAINLYQHHISTFLILLCSFLLIKKDKSWLQLLIVWFLITFSLVVDYPNFFLMFPLGLAALIKVLKFRQTTKIYKISFKFSSLLSLSSAFLPLILFGIFNFYSYGSPYRLSGTIASVSSIDSGGEPIFPLDIKETFGNDFQGKGESALGFFRTRNIVNGLYVHLLSPDRGVAIFSPVILFGILGIYFLHKNKFTVLFLSIVVMNIILYSMWGDPWGGWAFGSRYLIPGYAIMSIFISIALTKLSKNKTLLIFFSLLLTYSIAVNTLGAITTSTNPPKIQAIPLQDVTGKIERYSYDRNWEYLNTFGSKSYVFREYVSSYINARSYYFVLTTLISGLSLGIIPLLYLSKTK